MRIMSLGFIIVLLLLLVNGCAQQSVHGDMTAEQHQKRMQQSAKIHTELAAEYYYRGQFDVAIDEITEALQADENYAPAHNVLGLVYMALHDNDMAHKNFKHALKLTPNDPEVHNNYGWFLCQRMPQQMDKAMDHFLVAIRDRMYSTPEKSFANAGACEIKRGDYDAAAEYFRRALLIQSTYSPAVVGLIEVDFRKGSVAGAKTRLSKYMQRSKPTPEGLWLAIQIERELGDQYAADSYQFQLQKHFPSSKEATALREDRFK